MRTEDVRDYLELRRIAHNPWEIVTFRKRKSAGRTLHVRLRNGREFALRSGFQDFHIFHRIFMRDEYRLKPHDGQEWSCAVDLGGNVGLFALRASAIARRVISYEPFPGNFAQLERNARDFPEIEAVAEAVADKPGTLELYRPRAASLTGVHSAFPEMGAGSASAESDTVPATTLDRLFERHEIARADLVKIDVEGSEYDILYATSDATFGRIRRIYGEYHDVRPDDPSTRIDALVAFLGSKGFETRTVPKPRKTNLGMFYAERAGA